MSFKVLIVPEDPYNNGYILKPLIERVLRSCGKPQAVVKVLDDPRARGYEHAKMLLKSQIFQDYRFMDLILFLPDSDGRGESRGRELLALEEEAGGQGARLLCCAAEQEVEVWLLAGHRERLERDWRDVRADPSVKENVFEPFLLRYGNPKAPGRGRDALMSETLQNYDALLRRCPELADLERRIRGILAG